MPMTAPGDASRAGRARHWYSPPGSRASTSKLDLAPGRVDAVEPRAPDPRLVDDQEVARAQQPGQLEERPVLEPPSGAQVQQARRVALGEGLLRDPLRRERVVEVGGPQRSKSAVCASAAPGAPAGTERPRCW